MTINAATPKKSVNKAYLKERINRADIELFKSNFTLLFARINATEKESEENRKNIVADFLKQTFYTPQYEINTKGREDLVIHTGKTANEPVGVLFEIKMPNSSEMMTDAKPNTKALQQLIFYYLRERIEHKNISIKHLIATDIFNWYIFDENLFDKHIYRNAKFIKGYETYKQSGKDTEFFYKEVAKPLLEELDVSFDCTHFNLKNYENTVKNTDIEDDKQLIALFKILSPTHLLKLPFANDSNQLDKNFYAELLHIIGLEEVKEGSKKIIQRKAKPDEFSLIENTITKVENRGFNDVTDRHKLGNTKAEQVFNIALELSITWVNRILFLKLLEAQLVTYNRGNRDFSFLNTTNIYDYDRLNKLFFEVLAEKLENRKGKVKTEFERIPYLNSSLFERTELERKTIEINYLDDGEAMPILPNSVLKDDKGKKKTGQLPALEYLFAFLDSYDFASEGTEGIQDDKRTLINASVLGLIFEKINGYKDGSFFTPGFITMYMCRETIRRAVVQKFKENGYQSDSFEDLKDEIKDRKQANNIINSLKICDPAVGSGHFLVSALNEIIALKSDLDILSYRDGSRIKLYKVEIQNDELIVTDEDSGDIFQYYVNDKGIPPNELQRLQEALFHEKQTLIENCLFGVDINPNSVKICRLRLWIELLKNAYYVQSPITKNPTTNSPITNNPIPNNQYTNNQFPNHQLETLPNIDINIKQGNSLISRFKLNDDLSDVFKKQKFSYKAYRKAVEDYKNAASKEDKKGFEDFLKEIKTEFQTSFHTRIKEFKDLVKFKGQLYNLQNQGNLFGGSVDKIEEDRLSKLVTQTEQKVNDIKDNVIYRDAFEWRFEFPEVLDTEGGYVGFDVVIGNPPYIGHDKITEREIFKSTYSVFDSFADIYCYFFEKAIECLNENGTASFITSNSFLRAEYGKKLRNLLIKEGTITELINLDETQIFQDAIVNTAILSLKKGNFDYKAKIVNSVYASENNFFNFIQDNLFYYEQADFKSQSWNLSKPNNLKLALKIKGHNKTLEQLGTQINLGLATGANEVFIINEEKRNEFLILDKNNENIIKPLLRGRDIKKYAVDNPNLYILLTRNELNVEKEYPTIFNYLDSFGDSFRNRGAKGKHWSNLRACSFFEDFKKEKIVWIELSDENRFTLSEEEIYLLNSAYFLITPVNIKAKFLLGILNSRLIKFYLQSIANTSGMGTYRWINIYVKEFPIPETPEAEQQPIITLVEKILSAKKATPQYDTSEWEKEIDKMVYGLYGLNEAEINIIEQSIK